MNQAPMYPTKFKQILEEKNISYSTVSDLSGITRQALCNYANGIRKPDIQTACIIIRVLCLKIEDIENLFEPVYY